MKILSKLFGQKRNLAADSVLEGITSKINQMDGADMEFAKSLTISAWSMLKRFSEPLMGSTIFSDDAYARDVLKSYKLLMCHHCMLLFFRDPVAKAAMRRLISHLTDEDYQTTDAICARIEKICIKDDSYDSLSIAMSKAVWNELWPLLGLEKSAEPLAIMVIMSHFDNMKSDVRHLFD